MSSVYEIYDLENVIADFFSRASVTRADCDAKAQQLPGCQGLVTPVPFQGGSSYSVYAGASQQFVVQFRRASGLLDAGTAALAREIHGSTAPDVSFEGMIGTDEEGAGAGAGGEALGVYLCKRIPGTTYLEFCLTHDMKSPQGDVWRMNLMKDIARFFATAWKNPQPLDEPMRDALRATYVHRLGLLQAELPERFRQKCLECLAGAEAVLSTRACLLHRQFGAMDVMVDGDCRLIGVLDWAEAEVAPFGTGLHSVMFLTGEINRAGGRWVGCGDQVGLQEAFWETFVRDAFGGGGEGLGGDPSGLDGTMEAIKLARDAGLLMTHGFRRGLPMTAKPVVNNEGDERGQYLMLYLDGLLLNLETKLR